LKFLCAQCSRTVDLERFRLDGAVLVVTCPACGAENRAEPTAAPAAAVAPVRAAAPAPLAAVVALRTPTVEAIARAAASAKERPFDVPEGHCPKCISKRSPGALACPSCGLTFSQAQSNDFSPSPWLQLEWLRLLGAWGDDAKHEALRAQAMNKSELAPLGRLYRLRLAGYPEDPYAVRGRDEVLRLAVLPQVTVRQLKVEPQPPMWKYVALSVVIIGCLVALFFLVRQMLSLS
jgi:hypothetical protein